MRSGTTFDTWLLIGTDGRENDGCKLDNIDFKSSEVGTSA